jgi:CheY-like chemotaxis protein
LLVEDEETVRTLSRRGLEAEGYTVLVAENAADAVDALERFAAPIDMLITDLVMPGMGGRDLAERLVQLHPTLRVLYITGYTTDAVPQHALLQKPFTPDELARRVREALDGHRAESESVRANPHSSTASE